MSNTNDGFHNVHMLWMFLWMLPYHIATAHVGQAFEFYFSNLEFWLPPPEEQTTVKICCWGYRRIQDGSHSHINAQHRGVVLNFYAVDVHMDEPLPCCHCLHWPSLWKLSRILVTSLETNHSVVMWLRLHTHSRWLPHQCKPYEGVYWNLYMLWLCI